MIVIDKDTIDKVLTYTGLIERLRTAFRSPSSITVPQRHHHAIKTEEGPDNILLLMPAWSTKTDKGHIGVKIVNVVPRNASLGLSSISGSYLLSDSATGHPLAVIDGAALTVWRTACASALAADYLARSDSEVLLMVGAGALSAHLIKAHIVVRPSLKRVVIWNRSFVNAQKVVDSLHDLCHLCDGSRIYVEAHEDLESCVRQADIITCATFSSEPLVLGQWVKRGTHVDLVGAFKPSMRETDDDVIKHAKLYVDTREGALKEGGDLVSPLSRGVIGVEHVLGDLYELVQGKVKGRQGEGETTVFKSVGYALEDLVGAELIYEIIKGIDAEV